MGSFGIFFRSAIVELFGDAISQQVYVYQPGGLGKNTYNATVNNTFAESSF